MFSQRIAGDPHAFDLGRDLGKLFLHVLSVKHIDDQAEIGVIVPTDTEAVNELLNDHWSKRLAKLMFSWVSSIENKKLLTVYLIRIILIIE